MTCLLNMSRPEAMESEVSYPNFGEVNDPDLKKDLIGAFSFSSLIDCVDDAI